MDKEKVIKMKNPVGFSCYKEIFEKFGDRRLFNLGEYFARSCKVTEYLGRIVSGVFKYLLTPSDADNRVIVHIYHKHIMSC